MKFTVLGAKGFIGSHLVKHLEHQREEYFAPERDDPALYNTDLGHVIYCIGLTANFRERPFDTVRAHVVTLLDIVEKCRFDSFLYLSSTRVYMKNDRTDEESDLQVNPNDPSDLYNLSKLMGESICFASEKSNVRVVRLSNVVGQKEGSSDFLSSVIWDAIEKKKVVLNTGLDSEKDYIAIQDVVELLPKVSMFGRGRLYNVASGVNFMHRTLLEHIQSEVACVVDVTPDAVDSIFPKIGISRIESEFGFSARPFLPVVSELLKESNGVFS